MYHRIMEILVLLMDEFGSQNWKPDQMDQLSDHLIQRGYTEQEINTAFYWLYHRFGWENNAPLQKLFVDLPAETSCRLLNSLEQRYVSPEAYGYLLQLRHLRLLSARELEEVIERAQILEFQRANVEDMKAIVQSLLFEDGSTQSGNLKAFNLSSRGETCH
ncbi:MAG: DUF494 family protein [bacterium]|nr:DUF494 family protein [bacterium]